MFANITTAELFAINSTHTREWLADESNEHAKKAVMATGAELTARGAW